MPPFKMPDGTFIDAPNYAAATVLFKARHAPGAPVPMPPPAVVQVAFTVGVTPEDPFMGRSPTKFGVGERVDLTVTTNPPTPAATFGGLTWVVKSGPGTIVNTPGNTGAARLTMGERGGAVVLELKTGGVVPAIKATKTLWVVEPSGAVMTQEPGTGLFHTNGLANAGFTGRISFQPADVSFYRCQFREGSATPVATGSLAVTVAAVAPTSASVGQRAATRQELTSLAGARHPVMGTWLNITTGDILNGCHMVGTDDVTSGTVNPPFVAGTFNWPIPWLFRVIGSSNEKTFFTATHSETVDGAGRMTISKAGCSIFRNAADATSAK